jgi:hypothetical protein
MVEYYNVQRRNYYKTGAIKNEYRRTYFAADHKSVAVMCYSGVQIAGLLLRSALTLAFSNKNPYRLPK